MDTQDNQAAQALSGIRVVDFTSLAMGPLATQILGDFGADVVKVEAPTGDVWRHVAPQRSEGMSHAFIQFNRNKRSLAIDVKSEEGRDIARRLIATGEVMVISMRPQAAARLGLDYDSVKAINPSIIYCAAYGYSERGPYAGRPAIDDTIQALSGMAWLQSTSRWAAGHEQFVASVVGDKATGLAIVNAVLAALVHRLRTGEGQFVEVPMFETMVAFTMPEHLSGRAFEPPLGEAGYARAQNRRPFRTRDGLICVVPYTTRHWTDFMRLIGRDDLAQSDELLDPVYRSRMFADLYDIVAEALLKRSTAEWIELLVREDIIVSEVYGPEELLADPHLAATGMWLQAEHPTAGSIRMIGFPTQMSRTPPALKRLPPSIGQHNEELLHELGIGPRP